MANDDAETSYLVPLTERQLGVLMVLCGYAAEATNGHVEDVNRAFGDQHTIEYNMTKMPALTRGEVEELERHLSEY